MPEEKPERATSEMKVVVDTFLRVGYSTLTDGYEGSFADYVDNIMQRSPEMVNIYRKGSRELLEAGGTVLEEVGMNKKELEDKYEMIKHIDYRARLG